MGGWVPLPAHLLTPIHFTSVPFHPSPPSHLCSPLTISAFSSSTGVIPLLPLQLSSPPLIPLLPFFSPVLTPFRSNLLLSAFLFALPPFHPSSAPPPKAIPATRSSPPFPSPVPSSPKNLGIGKPFKNGRHVCPRVVRSAKHITQDTVSSF